MKIRLSTHFLLTALIAGSLHARLPLLLVVVASAIVIAVDTAWAVADDAGAHGAPLPLGGAIGAGAVGKDLTPDGDRAGRTEGGGRCAIRA